MNNLRSIPVLLAATFLLLLVPRVAWAHELKDGVVERDVQLVVFPDRVEIQYTVEMNPRTRDQHIEQLLVAARKIKPSGSSRSRTTSLTTEPDAIRAAWDDYCKLLASVMAEDVTLTIDSKRQAIDLVSSETIEKHSIKLHFVFAAKFQVASESQSLALRDKNFEDQPGYHRMAIKGRRGVEVTDANVPVIVSRVKRVEWSELTQRQQQKASSVTARISLAGS